jgi:hypothetical protein
MALCKTKPSSPARTKLTVMLYPPDHQLIRKAGDFVSEANFAHSNLSPSQLIRILLCQASPEKITTEHINSVLANDRRRTG